MTFCLGIKLADGIVAVADNRITSGSETITAKKITLHEYKGKQTLFLMTSGLRSVRDKSITYFQERLRKDNTAFTKLYEVVNAFADEVKRVAKEDKQSLMENGLVFNLNALIGGQLTDDDEHKLYLVYPEGNWVEIGSDSPYMIIGNSGYGKPLLDRVLRYQTPLSLALKAAFLAFDATKTSSNDVDFPLDVVVYKANSFSMIEHRLEKEDMRSVARWWQERIADSVAKLPAEWIEQILETNEVGETQNKLGL